MALVGNISGSSSSSSIVGVTGSVIFANRSDALFPSSLPGGDISFFVSGSIGGKGNTAERTVAVFGGDVAVSGSLTVGTGSVTITSNDIQFGSSAMKIAKDGNDLKFFDITNLDTIARSWVNIIAPDFMFLCHYFGTVES